MLETILNSKKVALMNPSSQKVKKRANSVEIFEKEGDNMAKRLELLGKKFTGERNKFQDTIQKLKEEASIMQAQSME
uniref:Uncharacterized protein n=1 Tax=Romanomermis culicivorax TaxID=13658 RepID=A0A915IFI2_ROMCU